MSVNKGLVFERVKQIIVKQLGVETEEITLESKFIEDLGADSLDIIEVIRALEMVFELDIPDEDAEEIYTVNNAVEYITKNISDSTQNVIEESTLLVKNVP